MKTFAQTNAAFLSRIQTYLARLLGESLSRVSWRITAATLVLLSLVALFLNPGAFSLISLLVVAVVTPALYSIDMREHCLPNRLTVPTIVVGAVLWSVDVVLAAVNKHPLGLFWGELLAVVGAGLGLFILLNLIGGLGMGDVKLALALLFPLSALGVGWSLLGLIVSFGLGAAAIMVACSWLPVRLVVCGKSLCAYPLGPLCWSPFGRRSLWPWSSRLSPSRV